MKKITFIIAIAALSVSTSFAASSKTKPAPMKTTTSSFSRPYGMAGCGLGSQLIGKSGGQVFAATTNGSSANQMFGITTGTSNCVEGPNDEVASRMDRFIVVNASAMAADISRGNGETVVSISHLLGCSDSTQVGSALQENFGAIFPSHDVAPNIVTDSIISVVKTHPGLSCSHVI